jgi:hypothetical protein
MVTARKKRIGMVLESYKNWMPIANAHLGYLRVVRAIKTIPTALMLAHEKLHGTA